MKTETTLLQEAFTPREKQIIRMLAQGLTAGQIARTLYIAYDTVRTHRKNILEKSGCRNTTHLVAECIRQGLI